MHAHGHAHSHEYALDHHALAAATHRSRRLLLALVFTTLMMGAEVVGGLVSNSLALLADAGHMLVDSFALLLAFLGVWLAGKPADTRRSYGYGRLEVLAGFINALIQFLLVGFICYEAVERLFHLDRLEIMSGPMFVVATIGLLVNLLVLRMLGGHTHDDVNTAGAVLHVLGDLLGSVAAILAALAIRWLGWKWADPLLSLLVSLLIIHSAWRLLRRSTHILLEGVPDGLDMAGLLAALRDAEGSIRDIHHLHVWQLASGSRMATLHAQLYEHGDHAKALKAIHDTLRHSFGIRHATVQIDAGTCPDHSQGHECHGHR